MIVDRFGREWEEVSAKGAARVLVFNGLKVGFDAGTPDEKIIYTLDALGPADADKPATSIPVADYFASLADDAIEVLGLAGVARLLAAGTVDVGGAK